MDAKIAGMTVRISGAAEPFFTRRLADYRCDPVAAPALSLHLSLTGPIALPPHEVLLRMPHLCLMREADGRWCRYRPAPDGTARYTIHYTDDFSEVSVALCRDWHPAGLTSDDFFYMLTGACFSDRLAATGGLVLHGSALAFDGEGVIFSADSGTGKSTHTGFWQQVYGDRVRIVNDDKPALIFPESGVCCAGTPWSGKTTLNQNKTVPLRAVVLLERAAENWIVSCPPAAAVPRLLRQLVNPGYAASLGEKTVDAAVRLLERVPCYTLGCTMGADAARTACRGIFGEMRAKE